MALLALAGSIAMRAHADELTLYRCVDVRGTIAIQDRPCPVGSQQRVLKMQRPVDAPPSPPVATAPPPPPVEVRIVHDRGMPPTYECTNAQTGETYLNHSGVGQSRYVPYWAYGVGSGFAVFGTLTPAQALHPPPPVGPPQPPPRPAGNRHPYPRMGGGLLGYSYVEDHCDPLPQGEVCARLRDRDDALEKLIFNAQPSDRRTYEREQIGVREQLREGCG